MVNLNIRVKRFALPESGERKRNLTTLVLVKRDAVKRSRSRQKVSESSQNPLKWSGWKRDDLRESEGGGYHVKGKGGRGRVEGGEGGGKGEGEGL